MTDKVKGIISLILLISLMAMMFGFSSQNSEGSSGISLKTTEAICEVAVENFSEMTVSEKSVIVDGLHYFVRKAAHFTIYMLMGICAYNSVLMLLQQLRFKALTALSVCVLYAVTDEIHQLFVPGRAFMVTDILIDSLGALIGMALLRVILLVIDYIKKYIKEQKVPKGR